MATVDEYRRGRSGNQDIRKLEYLVQGTSSDDEALLAVQAQTLEHRNAKKRGDISFHELGGDKWLAEVEYGRRKYFTGQAAYEFNYQAPSAHINFSLSTISTHIQPDATLPAPNFHQAINVIERNGEQEIDGVDLPSPHQTNTWAFFAPADRVTQEYEMLVESMQGKVNSVPFRGREPGTMRFVSCQGGIRTSEDWEIRFGFQYSAHRQSVNVGGITIPFIGGHNLLWVFYKPFYHEEAKSITKKPLAAYVEKIYEEADFNELGFAV